MATVGNSIKQKTSTEFCCEICDYVTERKSNFDNHLMTAKHQMATNGNSWQQDSSNNFCCENCNKKYKDRTGLWKHKKKCNITVVTDSNADSFDKEQLILMLIKQNADLIKETTEFKNMMMGQQNIMMEQQTTMLKVIENGTHNTTNSHNKSFNLQFFLNETCKDAMNIMDFVDSIKLQLCDLENVGKVGYINGISSIIVKNLNLLDETKRPVHCTDTKREVLYVKDEDKWQKENENKPKIRKMIKHVTHKNTKLFKDFKDKYPGCEKSESKYSNTYDKLIVEAFGGKGDNYEEKEDKIIKNILKEIKIEKQ
jgi:hypothetical protein